MQQQGTTDVLSFQEDSPVSKLLKETLRAQTAKSSEQSEVLTMREDIKQLKRSVGELKEKLLLRTAEAARNRSNIGVGKK